MTSLPEVRRWLATVGGCLVVLISCLAGGFTEAASAADEPELLPLVFPDPPWAPLDAEPTMEVDSTTGLPMRVWVATTPGPDPEPGVHISYTMQCVQRWVVDPQGPYFGGYRLEQGCVQASTVVRDPAVAASPPPAARSTAEPTGLPSVGAPDPALAVLAGVFMGVGMAVLAARLAIATGR